MAVKLRQEPTTKLAMRVFTYSITYITLLFGAMALDVLVRAA
jgi:heme O synthase-like polyprenyltransferase